MTKLHSSRKTAQNEPLSFVNQLENIDVQIFHAPSIEEFREAISIFMLNTWNDKIKTSFTEEQIDTCIKELFTGQILPTGMEIISICWSVNGLDLIDTTHLIRHRAFSFSAQVHGDRDMRHDRVMVKPSIMLNSKFYSRYKQIVNDAQQLYIDMLDSDEVHGLDARTIMPRCFEHFYLVKSSIKDLVGYCKMRGDEQIQTVVDNIVAMKLWIEILKRYPFLYGLVDFTEQDHFYINQCRNGKTNIFPPNDKNNCFEWTTEQFYHPIHRDDYLGGESYTRIRAKLMEEILTYKSQSLFVD